MSVQLIWGKLNFRTDGQIVRGVSSFSASLSKKGDDSKSKKTYTEAEEVSFSFLTSMVTGGNPIKDYNYLKSFIAFNSKAKKAKKRGYPLKVSEGEKDKKTAWRGGKFELTSVRMSNTQMDSDGRILAAEIELKFTEIPNKNIGTKKFVNKMRKKSNVKGTW